MLKDMLGSDVRSRVNARKIYERLEDSRISKIDLSGIEFVSRSVADEFWNIIEAKGVEFVNPSLIVSNMMVIVNEGRKSHRVRVEHSEIVVCDNMEDLKAIFEAM